MSESAMLSPLADLPEREKRALLEAGRQRGRVTISEACVALGVSSLDGVGEVRVRLWLRDYGIELLAVAPDDTINDIDDQLEHATRERLAEAEAELEAGVVPLAVLSSDHDG